MKIKRYIGLLIFSAICTLNPDASKADLSFRDHRYDSFHALPPANDGDIIFIGNSITNMMNWNELFGNNPKIKNRGTSGGFTKEILEHLESMVAGNPSKVFVMIGTNDLGVEGYEFSPEAVAYRIEKILTQIREKTPKAHVYFQSILPSQKGFRTREKTESTNILVEEWILQQNDSLLTYIDLYSLLEENGGMKNSVNVPKTVSNSFDDLHLTQRGYKIWADIISEYVGEEVVIPENAVNHWGGLSGSKGMRTSFFGVFPIEKNDILIIGDELVHSGEWHEIIGSSDFKDRGIGWGFPGINLDEVNQILDPIFDGNVEDGVVKESPKAVCLYAGMADIQKGESGTDIAMKYQKVLNNLREKLPSTPFFIIKLLPLPETSKYKENGKSFNNALDSIARVSSNIFMVDIYSVLSDINGNRIEKYFMGPSSEFLNGIGYAAVAQELVGVINEKLATSYKSMTPQEAELNVEGYDKRTSLANTTTIVFDNASSKVPYRIPAIACNTDGDLIAVTDYRYSKADIGMVKNGKVDLRYRIKDAKSGEWGEIITLAAAFGEDDNNIAFGDPCIVADRESNRILVTSCSGNVSFPKGSHDNHQGWARFYSDDGGRSWSEYEEIGDQLLNLLDKRADGPVRAFFIGSGKISQSSRIKIGDSYRLYCAALVKVNDGSNVNYVLYSDDFGKNWNILGDVNDCPIPYGADEPKAEELPDGNVLVSSRIAGGRFFNIFYYDDKAVASGKWGEMATSNSEVKGVTASSNPCNGEILCLPVIRNSDGAETFLLLQSVPLNTEGKRANVGINFKDLGNPESFSTPLNIASDWQGVYEVTPHSSAYSTMVLDKDNDIVFFFEKNAYNGGFDMIHKKLPIQTITNGKYSPRR